MASNFELFNSEPSLKGKDNEDHGGASCPIQASVIFGFVILFNWDESKQKPFKLFPRKAFPEIREVYLQRDLPDEYRIKKLRPLKPLPGQIMSLFAKVESGMIKHFFYGYPTKPFTL